MRAVLKFKEPRDIAATISLTMTMEEWSDLKAILSAAPFYGPAQWLREAINDLHQRATVQLQYEPEGQE